MSKQLKVLVYSTDGVGHVNACVGIAQTLKSRGHQIIFLTSEMFKGQFIKFGFDERILPNLKGDNEEEKPKDGNPMKTVAKRVKESGLLSNLSPLDKLKSFKKNPFFIETKKQVIAHEPLISELLKQDKPDLIIVDHFILAPSIIFGKIPWVYLFSGNPLFFFDSKDIPPPMSGLPSNDKTHWEEFRKATNECFMDEIKEYQNEVNQHFGFPETGNFFEHKSPYLNVYGYPEELDYTDVIPLPDNIARVDAFYRMLPEPFELPEEFKRKFKAGDRLIYVSLGSMGSVDVELMKRIVSVLKKSPNKFIVSRGPLWEEYELGENMWGEAFLPQTSILPFVDAVITHGGNNTVTETVCCGKPMIVLPLFADQFDNAQRVHEKGFGVRLDTFNFTDEEMLAAIEKITTDLDIRQRVAKTAIRIAMSNSKGKLAARLEEMVEKNRNK